MDRCRGGGVIGASSIVLVWDVILGGSAGFSKVGISGKFWTSQSFARAGRNFKCTGGLEVRNSFEPGQNLIKLPSFALYSKVWI